MRIAVTGAGGMLGQDLCRVLGTRHEVYPLRRGDLDITDPDAVTETLGRIAPQVVVHAAGWTDVDGCERDPDRAFRVNALGSRYVALGAASAGAALLYLSTDYVFDGAKKEPYTEWDPPAPLSVYGASKLAGEREVRALCPRHWIVRTSWLFGPGRNFVATILAQARRDAPLRVVDDQVGSPTYTEDLAAGLAALLEAPRFGIYHLTNGGHCSWFEFATAIVRAVGLRVPVEPIPSTALARPAPRPPYSVLRNACWELEGRPPLRPWPEALSAYLARILGGGLTPSNRAPRRSDSAGGCRPRAER